MPQILEERRMLTPAVPYAADNAQPSFVLHYIVCVNGATPTNKPSLSDSDGPYLGEIRLFAGDVRTIHSDWRLCNETGGNVPDFAGRVAVGAGQGPGLTNRPLGASYGGSSLGITTVDGFIAARTKGVEHAQPSVPITYCVTDKGSAPGYVGQVRMFTSSVVPGLKADGAQLASKNYASLYDQIGTTYGGDAARFALPDLRGRVIRGSGNAQDPRQKLGASYGSEVVKLGGNGEFATAQPSLTLRYMICQDGVVKGDGKKPMMGEVRVFTGNTTPAGWLPCDGRMLRVSDILNNVDNFQFYDVLGEQYGVGGGIGVGPKVFGLPDLRGRIVVGSGFGKGPALGPYEPGEKFGDDKGLYAATLVPDLRPDTTADIVDANDGKTSLREAVLAANLNNRLTGDRVTIPSGTYVLNRTSGPLVFTDTTGFTFLIGTGAGQTLISGNDEIQILSVEKSANFSMTNVTLTRGKGDSGGAANFQFGSKVALSDVTISNSSATNGGAVYGTGASLDLKNVKMEGNKADDKGGALYVASPATSINCDFSNNTAAMGGAAFADERAQMYLRFAKVFSNDANFGAGIYNAGKLNSPDSTLENNTASVQGGAYYNAPGGELTISRDTMIRNEAVRDGGGIANFGKLLLQQARLDDNKATRHDGGGLANFGTADVAGVKFLHNSSGLDGGGIANLAGAKLTLKNSALNQNEAGQHGGAIFDRGLEQITATKLSDNTAGEAGAGFYELGGIGETFHNTFTEIGDEVLNPPETVLGAAVGTSPVVQLRDDASDQETFSFEAYAHSFTGGVRVAQGYLADNAGIPTPVIVTVPASGALPIVRVFEAFEGALLREFRAVALGGGKGASLALADVTGDGLDDIILGSSAGVPSRVAVYSGEGRLLKSFAPFAASFPGGIHVAAGDTTGDGTAEILIGSGSGASHPGAALFNFQGKQITGWPLAAAQFAGGVNVAVVDRNGDGYGDVVVAQAAGGSEMKIFDGRGGRAALASFSAYAASFTGGVNIASDDVDGDGIADLVVGPASGNTQQVRAFNARTLKVLESFAVGNAFKKGAYVG
jgi:predicted outer membrane repeat protein